MTSAQLLLHARSETLQFEWTPDDVMLYALAVGAGQQDPGSELHLTTENTEGHELVALPTFANIITRCAKIDLSAVDPTTIVHAEQAFELHRPLPTAGRADVTARVVHVWDKGSGALVVIESRAVDAGDRTPIATTRMSLFLRGAGGFDGERGPTSSWTAPTAEPDVRATFVSRPEQALIYRLTGDRNPLHSDPHFASQSGFERPILHGMCTYGYVGRLLFATFCDSQVTRFGGMRARFVKPVRPGHQLELTAWRGQGVVHFSVANGDSPVMTNGRLELRS